LSVKVPTPVYWPGGANEGTAAAGTVIVPELSEKKEAEKGGATYGKHM
jgi:hypothetical protein